MRTPLELARALGWPEARRHRDDERPLKVIVWRARPGVWCWTVGRRATWNRNIIEAGLETVDPEFSATAPSQPAALALGLAALDTTRSH